MSACSYLNYRPVQTRIPNALQVHLPQSAFEVLFQVHLRRVPSHSEKHMSPCLYFVINPSITFRAKQWMCSDWPNDV